MIRLWLLAGLALAGCRGAAPGSDAAIHQTVKSLIPQVEKAVGVKFRRTPRFELRDKEQVRGYLTSKLDQDFPANKVAGMRTLYSLLGLIPDTLDLKSLLLSLYAEQVVGYYDPDSTTLYAVRNAGDEDQLRLVLAHELVHALQHEKLPLEQLLKEAANADRLAASQAVLEGHAVVAMIGVVSPNPGLIADNGFWLQYRESVKSAQTSMPVFARAPLVLRESLIFPYLGGAEFIRWWDANHEGTLPSADQMPLSTEQVLHPDRYQTGDQPLSVRFADSAGGVIHDDTMGELELAIWATEMRGGGEVLHDAPLGWAGDRVRAIASPDGPALVLYTVWDDSTARRRFAEGPVDRFGRRVHPGYQTGVTTLELDGHPALRIMHAPTKWSGWANPPQVTITAVRAER